MFVFFPSSTWLHGLREEADAEEEEMESEKEEEEEDSEESVGLRPKPATVGMELVESAPLTKAQTRELRRLMKLDCGWFSNLLDSWRCTEMNSYRCSTHRRF